MGLLDFLFGRGRSANQEKQTDHALAQPVKIKQSREKPYLAFIDVETPNRHNDRICSIGLIVSDRSGNIEESRYDLIDPETYFDYVNTNIHGISSEDVLGSISFQGFWDAYFNSIVRECDFVAHNAAFDMSVISKALASYDIQQPKFTYACTLAMSRSTIELPNYKLPTVCSRLGISVGSHHHAMDDARACFDIYWELVNRYKCNPVFSDYGKRVRSGEPNSTRKDRGLSNKTNAIRKVKRLIEEILSDGVVAVDEAEELLAALMDDDSLANDPSLSMVSPILQEALLDGCIDSAESDALISALSKIVDPVSDDCEFVSIEGHTFVLTGTFGHGSRDCVASYIEMNGGTVLPSVTKKCDYVVIGENGSSAYAMGNYGTKVKKALDMQAKGDDIKIISEDAIYSEEPTTA